MQIVVLCGGRGTRLKSLTNKIPKVMIPFWGKPFLGYVIRRFLAEGFYEFVLLVGYLGKQIEKYFGDDMIYSYDGKKLLGTGGSLKKAEPLLGREFILASGDNWLDMDHHDLISKFQKSKKMAMMVYTKREKRNDVLVKKKEIIRYDKKTRKNVNGVWTGTIIMKKEVLKFSPKKRNFSLEEDIFPKLIEKRELGAYFVKGNFYPVGRPEQIKEFYQTFL